MYGCMRVFTVNRMFLYGAAVGFSLLFTRSSKMSSLVSYKGNFVTYHFDFNETGWYYIN